VAARDTTEGFLLASRPVDSLDAYTARGGGRGLARARQLGPSQTIQEVSLSGLRGRGGAGFPTGRKWATVATTAGEHFVAVNAAEGEPGTFKDRALLRANPYQLVEGAAIAALAVGARRIFIAVKRTFSSEVANLERAVNEFAAAGLAEGVEFTIVLGPDEYLFGEEKAMLEVIEGKAPLPRLFPPYLHGLFAVGTQMGWEPAAGSPAAAGVDPHATVVNNVETLSNVPHIIANGAEWFRGFGTSRSPGVAIVTVVGDVQHPNVAEVEMGVTLRDALDAVAGGLEPGRSLKAAFSGISNPVITAAQLDTPLTYEDFAAIGNGLGAAGFVVYDDRTNMVEVARLFSRFLAVESCGQCPPCKIGNTAIADHLTALSEGWGNEEDMDTLGGYLRTVTDGNRCALPQETQAVVGSLLRTFPEDFAAAMEGRTDPPVRGLTMPKLTELTGGVPTYDERYRFKQLDWTYAGGA
jgi:NADH-quinone oxidoreductase subunit F